MSMFEIQKLNRVIEQQDELLRGQKLILEKLDRLEVLVKNKPYPATDVLGSPLTGAPAQRAFNQQPLMPTMPVTVKKEPKK